jgi:putative nucleotidyltransferase with HDIG domain
MNKLCQKLRNGEIDWPDLSDSWAKTFPLLAELSGTPQDPIWHAEGDVFRHTGMVLREALKIIETPGRFTEMESLTLVIAAVFHDIGKPLTTKSREIEGRLRIISPRHAEAGRNYLCLRIRELDLPKEVEKTVLDLVGLHHEPRRLVQDDAPIGKWRQLARQCPPPLLYWLEYADLRGRICPDLEEQLEIMELFRLRCEEIGIWECWDPWKEWRETIEGTFASRSPEFRRHAFQAAISDAEAGLILSIEEGVARAWQLREPPTELILLWGPSGAGKSSWIERHASDARVISLDEIRQEIAGKRADQSMNGQVMQAAKERLKRYLRHPGQVIWDATNLRRDMRAPLVQLGRDYGARVSIVALTNTIDKLKRNNRRRETAVPDSVQFRQIETLEWPTVDEAHEILIDC